MSSESLLFVCQASHEIGLGHLSRITNLIEECKKHTENQLDLIVFSSVDLKKRLKKFNHKVYPENSLQRVIDSAILSKVYTAVILDLCPRKLPDYMFEFLEELNQRDIKILSIDALYEHHSLINFFWIPSFFYNDNHFPALKGKCKSGWDSLLIKKRLETPVWKEGNRILVLTGASDPFKMTGLIPKVLEKHVKKKMQIHWVRGPFSEAPYIPNGRHEWVVHENPLTLDDLIVNSNYVISVFGVSFFEVLQYGIPTLVFSPYGSKDNQELEALQEEKVAIISKDINHLGIELNQLMENKVTARTISNNSLLKMKESGLENLSKTILTLNN
jgi:spore coat polysaccharide biosynthesis predicted glycosyltransferase SpsG